MCIAVTPLHPLFMAEIGGVDLARPLPAPAVDAIMEAFHRHAVLVFRDQPITDEQQIAFSAHFGPVMTVTKYHRPGEIPRLANDRITDISNVDHAGRILPADDARRRHERANMLWHTDNTFKHVPARCSLLSAREIPPEGGDTEFADMRAAYDSLPEARRRELDDLIVEHSIVYSRQQVGFADFTEGALEGLPPVRQVLIRRHPATGRNALYLASHASHIVGRPVEEGRRLLRDIIAFATQPRFVHRHRWRQGDLVLWDNRCTMHRACGYDDLGERRIMHRTTVSDEVNSVEGR